MYKITISLVMSLLLVPFMGFGMNHEDVECSFNFPDFESLLIESENVKLEPEIRDEHNKILTQKGQLSHKIVDLKKKIEKEELVQIEFKGGGCQHFGFSITFSEFSAPRLRHRYVKKYLDLAASFAQKSLREAEASVLISALEAAKKDKIASNSRIPRWHSKTVDLMCGEARCQLEIINPKEIKLNYDLAL